MLAQYLPIVATAEKPFGCSALSGMCHDVWSTADNHIPHEWPTLWGVWLCILLYVHWRKTFYTLANMKISKQLLTSSQESRSVPLRKNYGGEQTLCECLFTVAGKSTVAIMTMGKTVWTMKKNRVLL
jgi:hypothetical protein